MLYDGLITNNKVKLSENKDSCDYIFIDFRDFNKAKKYKEEHFKKLVIIDFRDQPKRNISFSMFKIFQKECN